MTCAYRPGRSWIDARVHPLPSGLDRDRRFLNSAKRGDTVGMWAAYETGMDSWCSFRIR